jgi:hypothetical protein
VVHLKDFSLVSPDIQSRDVLKAIETAIPPFVIEEAIANTKTFIGTLMDRYQHN